jgi:endonuclease/exonuclease/phosphatase family metal-dependent hydrolase
MGFFSFDTLRGFLQSTNILQRINKMGELLEKEQADVIALQEVHTYLVVNLLKTKLVSYPYIAYKRYLYGPRGGLVIFSKHPIENVEYINYKTRGSILNKSIVAHVIQNGILACKIKNQQSVVLNTYVTPNMDYDYSKTNRFSRYIEAQLKQLAGIAKNFALKNNAVFICGDFNTDKNSYLYKTFTDISKAFDIFSNYNLPTKHQEYYPDHAKVTRIDHMFVLSKSKPVISSTKHLFTKKVPLKNRHLSYLSDHLALKATVKL